MGEVERRVPVAVSNWTRYGSETGVLFFAPAARNEIGIDVT
jgi:hypothetical protein